MTSQQVNSAIDSLNRFTGQHIAMPNGQYHGECTAPITWYLQELGLPWNLNMQNNRADGWGVAPPYQLQPFFSFETFQQGKAYPRGTILMWNSPHIVIVLSDAGGDNNVVCYEQNADPDGAPCGIHTRTLNTSTRTCTHAMVPIIHDEPVIPFTVEDIADKQVKITPGHNKWNLGYNSFDEVAANPITTADGNTVFTARAILHHKNIPQYNYYLEDPGTPHGWNVLDAVDYTPPPPPPPAPPAAPIPFPHDTTKYTVIKSILGFASATDAGNHTNAKAPVPAGDYYVYRRYPGRDDLINLTETLGKPGEIGKGGWINTADNVPDPEPVIEVPAPFMPNVTVWPDGPRVDTATTISPNTDPIETVTIAVGPMVPTATPTDELNWKATYKPLGEDRKPIKYVALIDITVVDQAGRRPNGTLTKGQHFSVYGRFTKTNEAGQKVFYGRIFSDRDTNRIDWYGVPLLIDGRDPGLIDLPVYDITTTPAERKVLGTQKMFDYAAWYGLQLERAANLIHDVFWPVKNKRRK